MKRDMNLVRSILLKCEECERGRAPELNIDTYTVEQIRCHVYLMGQAGLLRVEETICKCDTSPTATPHSITWEGYKFLEAARDPSRWKSALKKVTTSGAAMTFDILKGVLVALSQDALATRMRRSIC